MFRLLLIISVLLVSISNTEAFSHSKTQRKSKFGYMSSLQMNAWGVQKLGQSLINETITKTNTTPQVFRRVQVGSGVDEHIKSDSSRETEDEETLRRIGNSLRKKKLLDYLVSPNVAMESKLEIINYASTAQSILPPSVEFAPSTIRKNDITAGGLITDGWSF
jgi:hypothetical protein